MKKQALGKGLKAFLPEEYGILKEERLLNLEIEKIKPNPDQPRSIFDPDALKELAASIKESGVLQPLVVVPDQGGYKIIVGERRWRAAQIAGLRKIPVMVRSMTTAQQHEASLIENLQREDLNPMEIAQAYQKMADDLGYTQQEIADKVGKDRASVANYTRLLKLPGEIQKMIHEAQLTMGHARALITVEDEKLQVDCARQIIRKKLSVRNIEAKIAKLKKASEKSVPKAAPLDADLLAVKEDLIKRLGTKVDINGSSDKGVVKIHYFSLDELNRIYETIKGVIS